MHDTNLFQEYRKFGVLEYKVYYHILINIISQVEFDSLRQLHMLDKTEDNKDLSWECCRLFYHCKKRR
jgi:hypothetical protein